MRTTRPGIEGLESRRLLAAGFQIELVYEASVDANVRTLVQNAANRWQQIITGDVPDVGSGSWGAAVDDIRITARVKSIDGAGRGVAQARPTFIRTAGGSKAPIAGEIEIDSADIASQTAAGVLQNIITHEISHALGAGTLWSQFPGLTTGIGGGDPQFLGANALREYRSISGNASAWGVPLETTGGAGTRDTHWRESVFTNELLTGFVNAGYSPISRVSVGQFQDIGYSVNYNAADYFTIGSTPPPPVTTGSVAGRVFDDANRNGAQDWNEAGLSGRTVYADANMNGMLEWNEKSTTTDGGGNYTVVGLNAGTYAIRQVVPGGSTQTSPAGNNAHWVNVSGGATTGNVNFGVAGSTVTPPPPPPPSGAGTVSGRVFNDANKNGGQDAGEGGLSGRTVFVDANMNGMLDGAERTTTTDGSGNYAFSNLSAAVYAIRQVVPAGSTQSSPSGNNAQWVNLGAGASVGNVNFGVYSTSTPTPPPPSGGGTVSGRVFSDANFNGSQDWNEAGLGGRTVFIDTNMNGNLDGGERSTSTDANGNYSIGGLAAAVYAVRQVLPGGATQTAPSGNNAHWVNMSANGSVGNLNFGSAGGTTTTPPPTGGSTIGGSVFRDGNWSGRRDAGEAGIAARTVYIDANMNGRLDAGERSVMSDWSGAFSFTGLASGTFAVRQVLPGGWTQTTPANNDAVWVGLGAGQSKLDVLLGSIG